MLPAFAVAGAAAETPLAASLTNTAQIRALPPAEVERGPAVSLDGLVSYGYRPWQLLFIQDARGGCYIFPTGDTPDPPQGTWIHLDGNVAPGTRGPIILNARIQRLPGPPAGSEPPRPRRVDLAGLAAGRDDAQWVETSGVVRAVNGSPSNWWLELGDARARVTVHFMASGSTPVPRQWLNAVVRVRGVCAVSSKDGTGEVVMLHTSLADDFVVEQAAPAEPFQEPLLGLDTLPPTAAGLTNAHRVRVRGTILHVAGAEAAFLADAGGGIRLQGGDLAALAPGDEVEAAGFVTWADDQWVLAGAETRKLRSGPPPPELLLGDLDPLPAAQPARLIRLEGKLVRWETNAAGVFLEIGRRRTGESLTAELPGFGPGALSLPPAGSVVRLSGLWHAQSIRGRSAILLCRKAADVGLVQLPRWWSPKRVAAGVAVLVTGGLALSLWVFTLRRQVRRQTGLIREQVSREAQLNRRFRELFEQAGDAVLLLGTGGRITDLNPTAVRLLQGTREGLLGQAFPAFLAGPDASRFSDYVRAPGQEAKPGSIELTLAAGEGPARVIEITSCLRRGDPGGTEVQLIAHDITERKRAEDDLARVNREFQAAARLAGMAEVATGVLHNVGNVLNSVNLSATLVVEQVRKSKTASLAKAAELLREHRGNMGEFLTLDPKGRQLPAFFGALAEHLQHEQAVLLRETQGLQQNLEHIKQIVAMQQAFAKVAGVQEWLKAEDLMEDALRMALGALVRHEIEVVREYGPVPPLLVDRHKALQILVNLIHNAKDALAARAEGRRLTLQIGPADGGERVRLTVVDNGAGIAAENLVRIFQHGFTTKPAGHGFGLHSGANAAREMGGSLSARSDGPGQGATFTLELRAAATGA